MRKIMENCATKALDYLDDAVKLVKCTFNDDCHVALVLLKCIYFQVEDYVKPYSKNIEFDFAVESKVEDKYQIISLTQNDKFKTKYSFVIIPSGSFEPNFGITYKVDEFIKIDDNNYTTLINIDNITYSEEKNPNMSYEWEVPIRIQRMDW